MSQIPFQKYHELHRLSELGINTPISFVLARDTYADILFSLGSFSKSNYWVIRASFEHKRLINRPAYTTAELEPIITGVFATDPSCKLFITELIPAIKAGIFAKGEDFLYCEYVRGALQSLARDGATPIRVLLKPDYSISFIEPNVSEFSYIWSGAELKTLNIPWVESLDSIEHLIARLPQLVNRCPHSSIIEWVQAPNYQLYAVDFKQSEIEFLGNHSDIHRGLVSKCLMSLPDVCGGLKAAVEIPTNGKALFIERPLYLYVINEAAFSSQYIYVKAGGLLSHLIIECSRRRIPCTISRALFTQKQK